MGARTTSNADDKMPGPGHYDITNNLKSPLGKINPSHIEASSIYSPGPGHYNPMHEVT
jgi:hypothetical protein